MTETAAQESEQPDRLLRESPAPNTKLDVGVAAAIAVAAVVARFAILYATHSTHEDFYITLRYAENIASGQGFVYNPGEHVLGTTTPFYTLLLALATVVHLDPIALGKTINILADGTTCFLLARLLAALGRPKAGWLAALLYATASAPVNFSLGGMETGLVTLAGLTAIALYRSCRAWPMLVALAILFLLRIDGLLLTVVLLCGWMLRERCVPWKAAGLAVLLVLPWLVFATIYFGSPIPTSVIAKVVVYNRTRSETLPNLADFRHQFLGGPVQIVLFAAFLVGAFVAWRDHRSLRAPLVWLALYYAAMLFSKVPAFGWYFVPPLPIYYGCAALGIGSAVGRGMGRLVVGKPSSVVRGRWSVVEIAVLLVIAVPLFLHLRSVARDISEAQRLEDTVRKPVGEWLARNTAPNEKVMLEPIGYIGYFSHRPVLDIVGLVSPEVLPYYGAEGPNGPEGDNPLGRIVKHRRPDLLLLRPAERKQLESFEVGPEMSVLYYYDFVRAFPDERSGPVFFLYHKDSARAARW